MVCCKYAEQSSSRDVSFTSSSVSVNSVAVKPSMPKTIVASLTSESDSAPAAVSSTTPCHMLSASSRTATVDLFSPLQECKLCFAACIFFVLIISCCFVVNICVLTCIIIVLVLHLSHDLLM